MDTNKPIRLIETFAGYGSQLMSLKMLGANVSSHCISEWDVNANTSYNVIHSKDSTDYSSSKSKEQLIDELYDLGISTDGKSLMTKEKIKRKGEKWIRKTYNEFKQNNNLGSVCNVHGKDLKIEDVNKNLYIMTYSFPCVSLSLAGKKEGIAKGSGTASSLLWEIERILQELHDENLDLPQILLMENVPQVISDKNIDNFNTWCSFLESLGYTNKYKILNGKDFGIAQNRKRCFMFSFLGEYDYTFPKEIPLKTRLKDYLENNVDESYYIENDKAKQLIEDLLNRGVLPVHEVQVPIDGTINRPNIKGCANTLKAGERGISNRRSENNLVACYETPKIIGQMEGTFESTNRVYDINGVSPTLNTCGGGDRQPKIIIDDTQGFETEPRIYQDIIPSLRATRSGLKILEPNDSGLGNNIESERKDSQIIDTGEPIVYDDYNHRIKPDSATIGVIRQTFANSAFGNGQKFLEPCIVAMRGRNPNNPSDIGAPTKQRLEPNSQGICNTLTSVQKDNLVLIPIWRIRKLTERECGRLMGVPDDIIDKMIKVNSKSALYRQFGNSIMTNCLMALFSQLNLSGVPLWNKE